jgi:hypothetical protein
MRYDAEVAAKVAHDVLGRPVLPTPPFRLVWMAVAALAAGLVGLISALP